MVGETATQHICRALDLEASSVHEGSTQVRLVIGGRAGLDLVGNVPCNYIYMPQCRPRLYDGYVVITSYATVRGYTPENKKVNYANMIMRRFPVRHYA